jgi:KipI family sensor histidine kinase inhibitor
MVAFPRAVPFGDAALLLELGDRITPDLLAQVTQLAVALEAAGLKGLREVVPAYASLLATFETPAAARAAGQEVDRLLRAPQRAPGLAGWRFRIPCCYEGECAPDLAATFPAPAPAVALHTGQDFLVYCIGFLPGFTYLGELPPELDTPRLPVPRTRVPAGSVGIAGRQTGIYPVESPGGWRIIGRTPVRLFDPNRTPPAALRPGDRVRFYPIPEAEYRRLAEERPWPLPS